MSADNLPDYRTTTKCAENGGACNRKAVKETQAGQRFLCCTVCGHFVEQLFDDPSTCPHPEFYFNVVKKEGPNKGRDFRKCKLCNKFDWIDAEGDVVDKAGKKRKVMSGAAAPQDPALAEEVKRLKNLVEALQMQMLALESKQ